MKNSLRRTLLLFIFFMIIGSNIANPVHSAVLEKNKDQGVIVVEGSLDGKEKKAPTFESGEIIIKFKDVAPIGTVAEEMFARAQPFRQVTGEADLDNLNKKFGLKKIEKVFKSLGKKKEIPAGTITKQKAVTWHDEAVKEFYKKFPTTSSSAKKSYLGSVYKVKLTGDVKAAVEAYAKHPLVEYVQLNYHMEVKWIPNDPYFNSSNSWEQGYDDLWGLKRINASQAWDLSRGNGVVVAVVDTGVDYNHTDLSGNIWTNTRETVNGLDDDGNGFVDDIRGWDFAGGDNNPLDDHGHGSHVAGTIAAVGNNGLGIIGVAPSAKIMPLKGLDANGSGDIAHLADGIVYAAMNGAKVINNSWGCGSCGAQFVAEDAVRTAYNLGVVVVFAAGNDGSDFQSMSPQNMQEVITVGSVDHLDQKSDFSNYGGLLALMAPGGESGIGCDNKSNSILSLRAANTDMYQGSCLAIVNNQYYRARGTSMAAPHVAGAVATLLEYKPTLTAGSVKLVLMASADDLGPAGFDQETGYGRLNVHKALLQEEKIILRITNLRTNEAASNPNRNFYISPGEQFEVIVEVINEWKTAQNVQLTVVPKESWVHLNSITQNLGTMQSGERREITFQGFIDANLEAPAEMFFDAELREMTIGVASRVSLPGGIIYPGYPADPLPMMAGWPAQGQDFYQHNLDSAPLSPPVVDLDNNGTKEVIYNSSFSQVTVLRYDGQIQPGWPQPSTPDYNQYLLPNLATGDLDGNNDKEIVGITRVWDQNLFRTNYYVKAWHHDGTTVAGWPVYLGDIATTPPIIADMDNDGKDEVIIGNITGVFPNYIMNINILKNGSPMPGWPVPIFLGNQIVISNTFLLSGAVGDLDGNGDLEIVMPIHSNGLRIFAFHHTGAPVQGWPLQRSTQSFVAPIIVMGDLDKDGKAEVVLGENDWNNETFQLSVFNSSGMLKAGFPTALIGNAGTAYVQQGMALGDLDDDGKLEIAINLGRYNPNNPQGPIGHVYVWKYDGSLLPGWPQITKDNWYGHSTPILGDLDGDGKSDVIVGTSSSYLALKELTAFPGNSRLFAWKANGTPLNGFPKETREMKVMTPSLGDMDGDGDSELVFAAASLYSNHGAMMAVDFPGRANAVPWPTLGADFGRSASAPSTLDSEWTNCAEEGGFCSFTGTKEVRYGANGSYFYKTLSNGTSCSNSVFGDPIPGVRKSCDVRDVITNPSDWILCAGEGGFCSFTGTKQVRYGANGNYFYQTLTNGVWCTNGVFGDPIPGVVKECSVPPSAEAVWSQCSWEGEFCSFSGTQQVRYGANGSYFYQTLTNGVWCNNGVFGDPIVGVRKACSVPQTAAAEWTYCAGEGEVCAFSGTKEVRYGANSSYFYKTLSNGTACSNSVFGDPIPGLRKFCDYR